ncbi:hypothetical protein [Microbacterium galbinum]|uniref:hypothetical protein n=1 Tax=Microbacterium galbinum TaxID=2851646 RepID=UPI001FFC6CBA|nr:hypothetical protein [Microbacterium galbinum]MCK2031238.1 hypothetical protein [Microbacterium galbinum]
METPFDWFGSVVVPVAAVLVSSAIAVWLARSERRAAERSALKAEVATLLRVVHDAQVAVTRAEGGHMDKAWEDGIFRIAGALQVLRTHLRGRATVVPDFLALILRAASPGKSDRLAALNWIVDCTDAWLRGSKKSRDFRRAIPREPAEDPVDLSAWEKNTGSSRELIEKVLR